jgi:hypothetical protein
MHEAEKLTIQPNRGLRTIVDHVRVNAVGIQRTKPQ